MLALLTDLIEDVYTATPLSDLWYTKNPHGCVFGVSHDVTQQGRDRPAPLTRVLNRLWIGRSSMAIGGD